MGVALQRGGVQSALRMRFSTASDQYPSDGVGGVTGTAGSSIALGRPVVVHGVIVETTTTATGLITIMNHAGTTQITVLPAAALTAQAFEFPGGVQIESGLRVTAAGTAMQITVLFSVL